MDYQQGTVVIPATVDRSPTNLDVLTRHLRLSQVVEVLAINSLKTHPLAVAILLHPLAPSQITQINLPGLKLLLHLPDLQSEDHVLENQYQDTKIQLTPNAIQGEMLQVKHTKDEQLVGEISVSV